jgi:cupin 2 domain-containing protein
MFLTPPPLYIGAMTTRHPRLLQDLPTSLDAEQVDELLRRPNLRIERIVSTGHASAETFWYDQAEHEWVVVLSGRAKLRYQGTVAEVELGPGDAAFIPAHTKHQIAWTAPDEPTVWLAVFWSEP